MPHDFADGGGGPALRLEPIMGPPLDPLLIYSEPETTIGRGSDCRVRLPEQERTVSRLHCSIASRAGAWLLRDRGSRHGTIVNGDALQPEVEHPLRRGDRVRIGPWTFRVADPSDTAPTTILLDEAPSPPGSLRTITDANRDNINRRRLELVLECAKRVQGVTDESALAEQLLDLILEGSGYSLVALIRTATTTDQPEVLGVRTASKRPVQVIYSRHLLRAAARGQIVQLNQSGMAANMTVVGNAIHSAMCVPVVQSNKVPMCLYLDARQNDPPVHDDAAAFCQAVAELCALAVANLARVRLEQEHVRATERMQAAMDIQRGALPPPAGNLGPVDYAVKIYPARTVAGDLFDIFPLDHGRVAFFMGDVVGKGVAAAILGAMTQAYIGAALRSHGDVGPALCEVNAHLVRKAADDKFVSLWCGILDQATGELRYVDAGHGYAMIRRANGTLEAVSDGDDAPLRAADAPYASHGARLHPGDALLLYSDGVAEQPSPTGEFFGVPRVRSVVAPTVTTTPAALVDELVEAVRQFAGPKATDPADDLSVAAIRWRGPEKPA